MLLFVFLIPPPPFGKLGVREVVAIFNGGYMHKPISDDCLCIRRCNLANLKPLALLVDTGKKVIYLIECGSYIN